MPPILRTQHIICLAGWSYCDYSKWIISPITQNMFVSQLKMHEVGRFFKGTHSDYSCKQKHICGSHQHAGLIWMKSSLKFSSYINRAQRCTTHWNHKKYTDTCSSDFLPSSILELVLHFRRWVLLLLLRTSWWLDTSGMFLHPCQVLCKDLLALDHTIDSRSSIICACTQENFHG